jgi:hypothetical protein
MFGHNPHIPHHQFRLLEDLGVNPLEDKLVINRRIDRDQKGVIDVAIAEGTNLGDAAPMDKLISDRGGSA